MPRSVELRDSAGSLIAKLEVAESFWARLRGLIGRPPLPAGTGLLLPGVNGVHMLFMRYPIDVLFLGAPGADGTRTVVAVRHSLPPWRGIVWWVRGARAAVELRAGTLAESGLSVGDAVSLNSHHG